MAQTEEYKERYKSLSQVNKALDIMYRRRRYVPSYYDEFCLCEKTLADIRKDLEDETAYLEENRESMSRKEIRKAEQQIEDNEYEEVIYRTKYDMFSKFIVDDIKNLARDNFEDLHTDIYAPGYMSGAISRSDRLKFAHADLDESVAARKVLDDVMYGDDDSSSPHTKGDIIYAVTIIQARYDGFTKAYDKLPSDRFVKNKPSKPAAEHER